MAKCPECGMDAPFFSGVQGKGRPHPYTCPGCKTKSAVSLPSAILWNLCIWIVSAAIFIPIITGFPPGKQYDWIALAAFILCVSLLPYLLGRFVWRWVKLRKVE